MPLPAAPSQPRPLGAPMLRVLPGRDALVPRSPVHPQLPRLLIHCGTATPSFQSAREIGPWGPGPAPTPALSGATPRAWLTAASLLASSWVCRGAPAHLGAESRVAPASYSRGQVQRLKRRAENAGWTQPPVATGHGQDASQLGPFPAGSRGLGAARPPHPRRLWSGPARKVCDCHQAARKQPSRGNDTGEHPRGELGAAGPPGPVHRVQGETLS